MQQKNIKEHILKLLQLAVCPRREQGDTEIEVGAKHTHRYKHSLCFQSLDPSLGRMRNERGRDASKQTRPGHRGRL